MICCVFGKILGTSSPLFSTQCVPILSRNFCRFCVDNKTKIGVKGDGQPNQHDENEKNSGNPSTTSATPGPVMKNINQQIAAQNNGRNSQTGETESQADPAKNGQHNFTQDLNPSSIMYKLMDENQRIFKQSQKLNQQLFRQTQKSNQQLFRQTQKSNQQLFRQTQKSNQHRSKYAGWAIPVATLISALFFGIIQYFHNEKQIKSSQKSVEYAKNSDPYELQRAAVKKYGPEQVLQVEKYYTEGNSTEQYFKDIFQIRSKKVIVVTGVPGNGKTTSIKYLLNSLRNERNRYLYINLRTLDKKQIEKLSQEELGKIFSQSRRDVKRKPTEQQAQKKQDEMVLQIGRELQSLLPGLMKSSKYEENIHKRQVLIIDDINRLQKIQKLDEKLVSDIQSFIIRAGTQYNVDVFLISSSSGYSEKMRYDTGMNKQSLFKIVQAKGHDEMRTAIKRIMEHGKRNVFPQTIEYMVEQQYSLRDVVSVIQEQNFQKDGYQYSDKQMLSQLIKKDSKKKRQIKLNIKGVLERNQLTFNKILDFRILKNMSLLNPKKIDISDCAQVFIETAEQIQEIQHQYRIQQIKIALKQLDQMNLLIYCRPLTKFIRDIFEDLVKSGHSQPKINQQEPKQI